MTHNEHWSSYGRDSLDISGASTRNILLMFEVDGYLVVRGPSGDQDLAIEVGLCADRAQEVDALGLGHRRHNFGLDLTMKTNWLDVHTHISKIKHYGVAQTTLNIHISKILTTTNNIVYKNISIWL